MSQRMKLKYLVLIGFICICGSRLNAFAAEATINQFTYTENNGVVTITDYAGGSSEVNLGNIFPDATEIIIGAGAFYMSNVTSITIPKNVTSIGAYSFIECSNLQTVIFEERTTETLVLGTEVFKGCSNLSELSIPDVVSNIPDEFCCNCSSLTSIDLPANCKSIGDAAFEDCALTAITIPSICTSLGRNAFERCTELQEVIFEERNDVSSVFSIGQCAFSNCSSLTSIILPKGCKALPDYAFYKCTRLSSITIPDECKSIGVQTFYCCSTLNQMNAGKAGNVILPKSCQSVGEEAFASCKILKNVTIPEACGTLGTYAFWECVNLNVATFENPDTVIGTNAFPEQDAAQNLVLSTNRAGAVIDYATTNNLATTGAVVSVIIKQPPLKLEYYYGESSELDTSGMMLEAEFTETEGTTIKEVAVSQCLISGYQSNKVGEQTITVSYGGKQATFDICVRYNLENAFVLVDDVNYTGSQLKPVPEVMYGGEMLIQDEDYTVTYGDNISVGQGYVIIKGQGNYAGSVKVYFNINEVPEQGNDTEDSDSSGNENTETDENNNSNSDTDSGQDNTDSGQENTGSGQENTGSKIESDKEQADTGRDNYWSNNNTDTGNTSSTVNADNGSTSNSTDAGNTNVSDTANGDNGTQTTGSTEQTADETPEKGKTYVYKGLRYKVTGKYTVAFVGVENQKLKQIKIPDYVKIMNCEFRVTKIGKRACYKNKKITKVTVGNNVTTIENEAFAKCTKLNNIIIGTRLKKIGDKVFYNDKKLKYVRINSKKLKQVGKNAFKGTPKKSIKVPEGYKKKYEKLLIK